MSFLSAFLQVLFDRMALKEVIDFFLNRPDKALLEELKQNFLSLKAVLSDAEEKQFTDPHVREWVDMLKDAAYDADDVFDVITTKASKSHSTLNQVRDYASLINPFAEVKEKLNSINEKLKSLINHRNPLGLKEGRAGKLIPLSSLTTSLVNISEVYGRGVDRNTIKGFLWEENASERMGVQIVAIVGMAGIGKTTLAQLLFNDDEVREQFPKRSWAYVAGGFDVYETTKRIYGSVHGRVHRNIPDLNLLQLELQHELEKNRFLLVLDDFWNDNFLDWDLLKRPFECGSHNFGSRIIVTTRNQSVASTIRADLIHPLSQLPEEHSWRLFESHAFTFDPNQRPPLRDIGYEIARRCHGLPLAAKTLGALLRYKEDPEEWRRLLDSKIWELPDDKSGILPALGLSYIHLPSHLKRCFAYCSIFPKGWEFDVRKLSYFWMAEGILPLRKTNRRVEDVGNECFQELLSRSFFQSGPQEASFVMHDLVHDLAQYVAGEFCSELTDINSTEPTVKLRHVSYRQSRDDNPPKFKNLEKFKESLRTFLPYTVSGLRGQVITHSFVEKLKIFRHLRVLSLSHYGITEVPNSIKKLVHLRYLDLSSTNISHLPDCVVKLYNLETLLLSNCFNLIRLPNGLSQLVNLCLLDIRGCSRIAEMPAQLYSLPALQVLRE